VEAHRVVRRRGSLVFQTIGSQMAVRLSVLRAGHPFILRKVPGTHFSSRLSRPQGHSVAGSIKSIEKSSDLIRNRTYDLPACTIVPQPTMLLHAPLIVLISLFNIYLLPFLICDVVFSFMCNNFIRGSIKISQV
jgi:hypothetical protein